MQLLVRKFSTCQPFPYFRSEQVGRGSLLPERQARAHWDFPVTTFVRGRHYYESRITDKETGSEWFSSLAKITQAGRIRYRLALKGLKKKY